MKTIVRLTIIILAVLLVATATWFAGYAVGANQTSRFGAEGARGAFDFEAGEGFPGGDRPEFSEGGGGRGGDRDDGGFSFFGLASFARTLIPISLVIAAVVVGQAVVKKLRPRPSIPASPEDISLAEARISEKAVSSQ
jgi:hypothetical protein